MADEATCRYRSRVFIQPARLDTGRLCFGAAAHSRLEMKRAAAVFAAICSAAVVFACAIDIGPFFKPGEYPEDQSAFRRGQVGLITPDLNKADELIAFRYLSGLTLDDPDAIHVGREPSITNAEVSATGMQAWFKARQDVSGLPRAGYFSPYRSSRSSPYVFYLNCLDDAFVMAGRTLIDRRQRYASESEFKDWVRAQDEVFVNCSGKNPAYPLEPAPELPALARADRQYQIAAAHFYAEDLETAEKLFSAIAEDGNSPWHKIGAYMVARTLLREVSLLNNRTAVNPARQQLQKIAEDPSMGSLGDSARGLLLHLNAIDNAGETLQSLAKQLTLPDASASLNDTVRESRYVLLAASFRGALSNPDLPEPFDWVKTLEGGDEHHALDKWRQTHSLPWLTLALLYSSGKDGVASELIQEADRLQKTSPAFVTARYNAIRLRMERGERDEPRRELDELLLQETKQPPSVLNAWRAERIRLATSFDDFLRWAPRTPIRPSFGYPRLANSDRQVLGNDSTYVLNYRTPLSKLATAARSERLPEWTVTDVAMAAWTRAFMLGDRVVMRDMTPILTRAHADWAANLMPPSGSEFEAWKFHAALPIARNSEFQPLVPVAILEAHRTEFLVVRDIAIEHEPG